MIDECVGDAEVGGDVLGECADAEGFGGVDLDTLVFTLFVVQFLTNHKREGRATLLAGFSKPLAVTFRHVIFLRRNGGYRRYKIHEARHKNR